MSRRCAGVAAELFAIGGEQLVVAARERALRGARRAQCEQGKLLSDLRVVGIGSQRPVQGKRLAVDDLEFGDCIKLFRCGLPRFLFRGGWFDRLGRLGLGCGLGGLRPGLARFGAGGVDRHHGRSQRQRQAGEKAGVVSRTASQ